MGRVARRRELPCVSCETIVKSQMGAKLATAFDARPDEREILRVLGLKPRATEEVWQGLVEAVREGFPAAAFGRVIREAGLSQEEAMRSLRLARASIFRKLAGKQRLGPDESQKLARLARVVLLAEHVLEDAAQGREWLRTPIPALGGVRPVDMLDTDEGARMVEEELLRIEYGFFA